MKKFLILRGIKFLLIGVVFIVLAGFLTSWLWNAILPDVLGVSKISFFQALGILLLSRLLFGRFGRHRGFYEKRNHIHPKAAMMREKWANMSEEERENFKQQWKERCKKN
ncbi:MAG: hypothetical protein IPM47_11495 [Sphingobacteriales bacterium]|nr:MAG: hypothetical protein IPM47_11495 [Sphingobacteriales bacterium]